MEHDPLAFRPTDLAPNAARAFERYDLLSLPVINDRGKLVGRLTVDAVVDFIRVTADKDALAMAGLAAREDLFSLGVALGAQSLAVAFVNLMTAFVATRFIGIFESTIQDLVSLATLMPIVASIGGNTGNQTVALVIRGFAVRATDRRCASPSSAQGDGGQPPQRSGVGKPRRHHRRAVLWMAPLLGRHDGSHHPQLLIAAGVGVLVPFALQRMGRDPAQGSSVLLTFVTDSMGFFLFLGLARLFL